MSSNQYWLGRINEANLTKSSKSTIFTNLRPAGTLPNHRSTNNDSSDVNASITVGGDAFKGHSHRADVDAHDARRATDVDALGVNGPSLPVIFRSGSEEAQQSEVFLCTINPKNRYSSVSSPHQRKHRLNTGDSHGYTVRQFMGTRVPYSPAETWRLSTSAPCWRELHRRAKWACHWLFVWLLVPCIEINIHLRERGPPWSGRGGTWEWPTKLWVVGVVRQRQPISSVIE